MKQTIPRDVDDYIAQHTPEIQKLLTQVRHTIVKAAPKAVETIKYAMPAYVLNGNPVYFAAYKKHIGFYPVPKGDKALQLEISGYKTGKGSIHFPIDQPMPLALIRKMVKLRIIENADG